MPFKKGQSGNPAGKPKGAINHANRALKEWGEQFLQSEEWRKSAERRILAGRAPHLESALVGAFLPKAKEQIEHLGELVVRWQA